MWHTPCNTIYTKLKTGKCLGKYFEVIKLKEKEPITIQIMIELSGKRQGHHWSV